MTVRPLRKILVANRGEIAVRVMRTCRELGIATAAVYSDPDREALHVRYADEAFPLGGAAPGETYLDQGKILGAAAKAGADAIHPGYGFLSENPAFARACGESGFAFIGPPAEAIALMGEKTAARARMREAGIPVVPGTPPLAGPAEAAREAEALGYPVLVKAAAGGGGKGMRLVERPEDLPAAFESCRREALSAFGDGRLYLEAYLRGPHHVEFQILADAHGRVVHLGERECSIQRRHQKIVEETPSPILDGDLRGRIGEAAVRAAAACAYVGAGTVEFLVDAARRFYFLEMNTRLQVEHPITEMVTGLDLVERQIRIAEGERIAADPSPARGAAIECRIYAEDPWNDFLPSAGFVKRLTSPGGPGLRDDTGIYPGARVPFEYDPLLAKLVVWAEDRPRAVGRMLRGLEEYQIVGLRTNLAFLRRILSHPAFREGRYDAEFVPSRLEELLAPDEERPETAALAAAAVLAHLADETGAALPFVAGPEASPWRLSGRPGRGER